MKHLLDYETLKEWGFTWATKRDFGKEDVVTSYYKATSTETDAHGLKPITLSMYPHPNFNVQWHLAYLNADLGYEVLFIGVINTKEALVQILSSCLVFKPKGNKEK